MRFSKWRLWLPVMLVGFAMACPKAERAVDSQRTASVDAGPQLTPEQQQALQQADRLEGEFKTYKKQTDEALWQSWLSGAPLDLTSIQRSFPSLFSKTALDSLRGARELAPGRSRAFLLLERALTAELINQALVDDNATIAGIESSATFTLGDKETPYRDVSRLLAAEKSAVKRKQLWAASQQVTTRLDAALARREAHAARVAAELGVGSFSTWAAQVRELDAERLAKVAEHLIDRTDAAWAEVLKKRAAGDVNLPVEALTRAELPRLMRVAAAVDAEFAKDKQAERLTGTLTRLGLQKLKGLTVDLTDGEKKKPLPLTVTPQGAADVRVTIRPLAGLREQTSALGELGAAVALAHAATGAWQTDVLGERQVAQVTAALFSSLAAEEGWLEDVGVAPERRATVATEARAQQLFQVRLQAAAVLIRAGSEGLTDAEVPLHAAAVMSHALGFKFSPGDAQRWRLDADEVWRSGAQLRASIQAAALRELLVTQFGATWWRSPEAAAWLSRLWALGSSEAASVTLPQVQPTFGSLVVWFSSLEAAPSGPGKAAERWPTPIGIAADAGQRSPDAGSSPDDAGSP